MVHTHCDDNGILWKESLFSFVKCALKQKVSLPWNQCSFSLEYLRNAVKVYTQVKTDFSSLSRNCERLCDQGAWPDEEAIIHFGLGYLGWNALLTSKHLHLAVYSRCTLGWQNRLWWNSSEYTHCGDTKESTEHAFFHCMVLYLLCMLIGHF